MKKIYLIVTLLVAMVQGTMAADSDYSYLFTEWSDYPITISDIGNWKGNTNELTLYYRRGNEGKKDTIRMSANVDQPSTLVFTLSSDERWTNGPVMSFNVYVDGKLAYKHNGETYRYSVDRYWNYVLHGSFDYPSYRPYGSDYHYETNYITDLNRHFVDIESGNHTIEIETINNYSDYIYMHFREVGIEKSPELSVNLAKAGTLGDEVLRAMDNNPLFPEVNIRNVRKLKISGAMGDADWQEIYNMNMLFSLDLSDADITEIKQRQLSQYTHSSLRFLHELKLPKKLTTIGLEAFAMSYIEDVDIPESVTSIDDYAFASTRLRHANIPNVTTLGHNAFRQCTMLEDVTMRKVENIGINTFAECYNIKSVVFEGTTTKVPERMFNECSNIVTLSMPETVTNIEQYAFYRNWKAETKKLPSGLKTIGHGVFYQNYCVTFALPEGLETIGENGLNGVRRATGNIPSTLTSVGKYGMANSYRDLVPGKPDTLYLAHATYGEGAFENCGVKNFVMPAEDYNITTSKLFNGCDSLESIKILSPTKLTVASDFVNGLDKKAIKVIVPAYLRTTYMRDSYWMDFTIESFSTMEMDSIAVKQNLELSQHDRFEGTPSVSTDAGVLLTIDGNSGMEVRDMTLSNNLINDNYSQLWTSTDLIHINGATSERFRTAANKWYFLALPFDCDLKRTVNENGAQYAIRYYDGAQRAVCVTYPESAHNYGDYMREDTPGNKQTFSCLGAKSLKIVFHSRTETENGCDYIHIMDANGTETTYNGIIGHQEVTLDGDHFDIWMTTDGSSTRYGYSFSQIYADGVLVPEANGGSWKNYNCSTDIIKAGTGFIFMTSQDSWTRFYSVDNGTKQTVFFSAENENNEQHFALQKHESAVSANRGWNLVGNPYPNYYNNHHISFSAPITLWTGSTYQAYSLRDDDIAIKPCQAIFVQCPEDVAEISFPASGRQTTDEIKDQANGRSLPSASSFTMSDRRLFDVTLAGDNGEDKTRIVFNGMASAGYELECDAAKFMSMDATVPQIYSVDADDTRYSINERPVDDGTVQLGVLFPKAGDYTISLACAAAAKVLLTDNETGEVVNITDNDYVFSAKAGASNSRFSLSLDVTPTAAEAVKADVEAAQERIYTIDGRQVNAVTAPGTYIVHDKKGTRKILNK